MTGWGTGSLERRRGENHRHRRDPYLVLSAVVEAKSLDSLGAPQWEDTGDGGEKETGDESLEPKHSPEVWGCYRLPALPKRGGNRTTPQNKTK